MSTLIEAEEPEPPKEALETGLWCGTCFLPSGIKLPLVLRNRRSRRFEQKIVTMCFDCGHELDDEGRAVD